MCAKNFDSFSTSLGKYRSEGPKFKLALEKLHTKEPSLNFAHVCYENIQKGKRKGITTKSIIRETITLTDLLQDFALLAEDAVPIRSTSDGRKEELLEWMYDTITGHSYFQG